MKTRLHPAVVAAFVLAAQLPLAADPAATPAPVTRLPGTTVEGGPTVIDRSDRRLHQLQNSLPELGSNRPPRRKLSDRAAEYLKRHRDPNQATGQQRAMMERAQTAP